MLNFQAFIHQLHRDDPHSALAIHYRQSNFSAVGAASLHLLDVSVVFGAAGILDAVQAEGFFCENVEVAFVIREENQAGVGVDGDGLEAREVHSVKNWFTEMFISII